MSNRRETDIPRTTTDQSPLVHVLASSPLADKLMLRLRVAGEQSESPGPAVEDLLRGEGLSAGNVDPEVLTDLVYVEWMLRVERGESPVRDEYCRRFPAISGRLRKQWLLDQSLQDLSSDPNLRLNVSATAAYLPVDQDLTPPRRGAEFDFIGKYKIISRLGAGGQAEVFRALHPDLDRDVVIKLLRPEWFSTADQTHCPVPESQVLRMIEEGRMLARLSHPHIAHVYDIDRHEQCPYLVMEYVQGLDLDQFHRTRPLTAEATARLLAIVARAVAFAHARGILHRDIKPQNIVVLSDGTPKLIDFGLAKLVDVWNPVGLRSEICGTISFMAPEQAIGDTNLIGPASDQFGLGAVLYFLLTGRPPFQGTNWQEVHGRAQRCEWNRELLNSSKIPAGLAAICTRAMAAQPGDRFRNANELATALETFVSRPRRLRRSAAVVVIALLAVAIIWLARPRSSVTPDANSPPKAEPTVGLPRTIPRPAARADLKITVHRGSTTMELSDAAPLVTGDELDIEANVPAGLTVMLFSINGAGQCRHVAALSKPEPTRRWRYPEALDATVPLTGVAGTECLILVGQSTPVVTPEQIESAWGTNSDWPGLPPATVLRFVGTEVIREQTGRDLGPPRSSAPTPTDQVGRTFERFARQLGSRCQLLEGLAFCHIDSNE